MKAIKRITRSVLVSAFALSAVPSLASADPLLLPWYVAGRAIGHRLPAQDLDHRRPSQCDGHVRQLNRARKNLQYLGSKSGVHYFFRSLDRAALSIYREGAATQLSYFERGTVRTVTLTEK